jgi:hypothetical protein
LRQRLVSKTKGYAVTTWEQLEGGPNPPKRYQIFFNDGPAITSFETLDEAIGYIHTLSGDRRYVIRDHGRRVEVDGP